MMILGISGCMALLVTGFGIKDSMEDLGQTHSEEKDLLRGLLFSAGHVIYLHARLDSYCKNKAEAHAH